MAARRFLWIIAILVFLVIAAAFAYRLFGDAIMRAAMVPSVAFADSPVAGAPDYAKLANWQAHPGLKADPARWAPQGYDAAPKPGAVVFYLTPTAYLGRDRWNAPLDDAAVNDRLDLFLQGQATVFNGIAAIYAPRYRQASFGAFLAAPPAQTQAFDLAYSDVLRAFDAFLAQAPADAPIILAGHSQGSMHLLRLMKDRVAGKQVGSRIVAVYAPGWPVSVTADLPALGLPACAAAEQAGCLMSWQSFAQPYDIQTLLAAFGRDPGFTGAPRRGTAMLCTNPLTGGTGTEAADAARNLGALTIADASAGRPLPAKGIGATCVAPGILDIGAPPEGFDRYVLPGNNYHVYDYGLFWANLRADAEGRLNAWLNR